MAQVHVLLAESKEPTIVDTELEPTWQTSGKYLGLSGQSLNPKDKAKRLKVDEKELDTAPKSDGEVDPDLAGLSDEEREKAILIRQLRKDYELKFGHPVPTSMKNNIEWMIKKMQEEIDPNNLPPAPEN